MATRDLRPLRNHFRVDEWADGSPFPAWRALPTTDPASRRAAEDADRLWQCAETEFAFIGVLPKLGNAPKLEPEGVHVRTRIIIPGFVIVMALSSAAA